MSNFQAEKLACQRILKKEFALPAYDANPLVIPFFGSHFQLLSVSGNTGPSKVTVTFDEDTVIEMSPGEEISGFLFRTVKLSIVEDGPTSCTVFISKETNGKTPKLDIDEEIRTKSKKPITRIQTFLTSPIGWMNSYGPEGLYELGLTVLDENAVGADEEFVKCEFQFDFYCTLDDPTIRTNVYNLNSPGTPTWTETFDMVAALNTVITSVNSSPSNAYGDGADPTMENLRVGILGLMFFHGVIQPEDPPTALDVLCKVVPFRNTYNNTGTNAFCCDGGRYQVDILQRITCLLPSVLDEALKVVDGISNGALDAVPRIGVKITRILTVLK